MNNKNYDLLQNTIESLTPISDEVWDDFHTHWHEVTLAKNEIVTRSGQVEKWFYFVIDGVMRLYAYNDGDEVCAGFTYKGDFSGVYDSFLAQTPSTFYLDTISECQLLRISYDELMAQFDKHKSIERWGRLFNAKILIGMAKRQIEARSYSAEEKFQRLYNDSPHIFQLVPQKHLASYLGMTPETFSRLRAKLR